MDGRAPKDAEPVHGRAAVKSQHAADWQSEQQCPDAVRLQVTRTVDTTDDSSHISVVERGA
jgi:hypothetical protein